MQNFFTLNYFSKDAKGGRSESTTTSTSFNNTITTTSSSTTLHLQQYQDLSTAPPQRTYYYSFGAVAIPLILLLLLLILLLFGWLYSVYSASRRSFRPNPEDQQQLCGPPELDPAVLEYRIVFRLGCPSPLFDYSSSSFLRKFSSQGWLEFLLIEEEEGAPLFQPVRFRAADLRRDRVCAELVLLLYRGWALPPLLGVLARHSEAGEVIFFYEFSIWGPDPETGVGTAYLGTFPIHEFMSSDEAFYEVKDTPEGQLKVEEDIFPLLPEVEWEPVELAFCAIVSVAVLAAVTMIIEYGNFYPGGSGSGDKVKVENGDFMAEQHTGGSLWSSLLDVLYVLPLIFGLLLIILSGYKYGIKK